MRSRRTRSGLIPALLVAVTAFVAASCGGSSLTQDQASVNLLAARVTQDQKVLDTDTTAVAAAESPPLASCHLAYCITEAGLGAKAAKNLPAAKAKLGTDRTRLAGDQFALQVARDQLTKDEH